MIMRLRIVGRRGTISVGNFVLPQLDDRLHVRSDTGARTERLGRVRSYDWQLRHIAERLEADQPGPDASHHPRGGHDPTRTAALIDAARLAAGLPAFGVEDDPTPCRSHDAHTTAWADRLGTVAGDQSHNEP